MSTNLDEILIVGMNDAISGGLIWARPMLVLGLNLTVLCYGLMMMYSKVDGYDFALITVKAMAIGALLTAVNYNHYVRDLFFTDLPNGLARAMNGPRMDVNSAQQFDLVWEAVVHFTFFMVAQAAWYDAWIPKFLAGYDLLMLLLCFGIWCVSRVLMSVILCLGPFLIVLGMFKQTSGYVKQWVSKLIAMTMLGLGSSIVMRYVFVIMTSWLRGVENNPELSVDEMLVTAFGICVIFTISAILMAVLPGLLAFGTSVGISTITANSLVKSAVASAGGSARSTVIGGAKLGIKLGRHTGSQ